MIMICNKSPITCAFFTCVVRYLALNVSFINENEWCVIWLTKWWWPKECFAFIHFLQNFKIRHTNKPFLIHETFCLNPFVNQTCKGKKLEWSLIVWYNLHLQHIKQCLLRIITSLLSMKKVEQILKALQKTIGFHKENYAGNVSCGPLLIMTLLILHSQFMGMGLASITRHN